MKKLTDKQMNAYVRSFYDVTKTLKHSRSWMKPSCYKTTFTLPNGSAIWVVSNCDRPDEKFWDRCRKNTALFQDIAKHASVMYFYTEDAKETQNLALVEDYVANLHTYLYPQVDSANVYSIVMNKDTAMPRNELKLRTLCTMCLGRRMELQSNINWVFNTVMACKGHDERPTVSRLLHNFLPLFNQHCTFAFGYRELYNVLRKIAWVIVAVNPLKNLFFYNETADKKGEQSMWKLEDASVFLLKSAADKMVNRLKRRAAQISHTSRVGVSPWHKAAKPHVANAVTELVQAPPARLVTRIKFGGK